MTNELDMTSLAGLMEFLAYQGKTGDSAQQAYAYDTLRGMIENLPSAPITMADAVALQALAITIVQFTITDLDAMTDAQPETVVTMRKAMRQLLIVLCKAGTALEFVTGLRMQDRQFFDDMTPTTVQ